MQRLRGVGPTHPKTGNLQNWAYNRVRLLSNCQPGLYPRDARRGIAYNIDVYQQEFQYGFVFPGKMVGESGQLNFSYRSEQIWLRRGAKALFEVAKISRDERAFMKHILHLPEREGIAIRFASRCSSPVGVAYGGGIIPLATWYPDLSDNPVPYLYPFGGKIIWNTHRD